MDSGSVQATFERAQELAKLGRDELVAEARKQISDAILNVDESLSSDFNIGFAVDEAERVLPGYATLDTAHRNEIAHLVNEIRSYVRDRTRRRPLNALMIAEPGAGKSHLIGCIANRMSKESVRAITFNMATMQSNEDITHAIDDLRNLKVNDHFPLLFLDEFDSNPSNYAFLLPLLWDGKLHLGHRDLNLGKVVVVLAGSNPDLPRLMAKASSMQILDASDGIAERREQGKLTDLLSRVNGGSFVIPDLDSRTADKICVAVSLLRRRFGTSLEKVPRQLLRFIALTKFKYGVRSIAHLIDEIHSAAFAKNALQLERLRLPLYSVAALRRSSISFHLMNENQALGIVKQWDDAALPAVEVTIAHSPLHGFLKTFAATGLLEEFGKEDADSANP